MSKHTNNLVTAATRMMTKWISLSLLSLLFVGLMPSLLNADAAFAQRRTVTVKGTVVDAATQTPLVGVTCIVEGAQRGTT
ncbi:MAG: hypothetical protein IJW80_02265, partial [Alistipes sp.]|nr:hypothetical protein [Alistipes sp.]